MAYAPIQLFSTPQEDYAAYWLKFYEQGTVTPLSMATDATGGTLIVKAEVSSGGTVPIGFLKTAGDALLNPFVDGSYDGWLFPTEAEADANDTTNAIQVADNLNADPGFSSGAFVTTYTTDIAANTDTPDRYETAWYNSNKAINSGTTWIFTGTTTAGNAGFGLHTDGYVYNANGDQYQVNEAPINVTWFGALGDGSADDTSAIQLAIDFAALAAGNTIGQTVFYPKGEYIVSAITLKTFVSHKGVGGRATIIKAKAGGGNYLFKLDDGPVQYMVFEEIRIEGSSTVGQTAFLFEAIASAGSPFHGGLWHSEFKNLIIVDFDSHGFWLKGGETGTLLPHQFNLFKNITVVRADNSTARALLMTGEVNQNTFINLLANGQTAGTGTNIELSRQFTNGGTTGGSTVGGAADGSNAPHLNRFLTCTIQTSDEAFNIDRSSATYIDNCWFENLWHSITIGNASKLTSIKDSRFAAAATDGSGTGYCVKVGSTSYAAIEDNFILGAYDEFFQGVAQDGVRLSGNTGNTNSDGKTSGYTKQLGAVTGTLSTLNHNNIVLNATTTPVDTIDSYAFSGEQLKLKVISGAGGYVIFTDGGNIDLPNNLDLILRANDYITLERSDLNSVWSINGTAIARLEAASIPIANYYIKGEFVWNNNPVQSAGKVLLGWSRLVTGTAHVLNTDWSACYVTTT